MVGGPIARQKLLQMQTYKNDPLSFRVHKKVVASQSARAHNISVAATQNLLLVYMYEALEHDNKGVPMLALALEPEDLKQEPEPTAILPAPGGPSSCLTGGARSDKVALAADANRARKRS